jgi:tetratricopeptide (TPR) repeat protein
LAEATGDDTTIVRIHNQVALSSRSPQFLAQSLSRSADALVRAERVGDPVLLFVASAIRQVIAANNGDIEEVDRCLALSDAVVSRLGQPTLAWAHSFLRATRAQIAGDVDEAEQFAQLALAYGSESGEPDAALLFGSQFIMAAWQRGTAGELVPLIEQAAADNPRVTVLTAGLAVALLEHGDLEPARRLLEEAAAGFEPPGGGSWLTEMTLHAEAALECESREVADTLFEALAPWASQFSTSGFTAEGPVSHYLGGLATVLGRRDEADAYFAASTEMCARAGAKFFAARTNLKWGQMLIELGSRADAERARDLLDSALTAARANGYSSVERRAAEALRLPDQDDSA